MWCHDAVVYCHNSYSVCPSLTKLHPFKWLISPRFANAMNASCEFKKYVTKSISNSPDNSHLHSIYTHYVYDKSENTLVCAVKWQWNTYDWCYWIALTTLPVMQSRALFLYSDLMLLQEFQPKATLPLAKILLTLSCHNSDTGPSNSLVLFTVISHTPCVLAINQ